MFAFHAVDGDQAEHVEDGEEPCRDLMIDVSLLPLHLVFLENLVVELLLYHYVVFKGVQIW